jgi:hypothetical protein
MTAKLAFVDRLPEGPSTEAGLNLLELWNEHIEYAKMHAQYNLVMAHLHLVLSPDLAAEGKLVFLSFLSSCPFSSLFPISLIYSITIDITHKPYSLLARLVYRPSLLNDGPFLLPLCATHWAKELSTNPE